MPSMNRNAIDILKKIYRLYDAHLETTTVACRKFCADCCTTNVTMTRLEGVLITAEANPNHIADALSQVSCSDLPRYRPGLSTNAYVEMCRTGDSTDEDQPGTYTGICPFLKDNACGIYPVRPFGCRCMISTRKCGENGYAEIDEFTLTVNTVFLQFIEHLDQKGFSGNLLDVLACLAPETDDVACAPHIIPNRPIPVLMVPPAHQSRIASLVNDLGRLMAEE